MSCYVSTYNPFPGVKPRNIVMFTLLERNCVTKPPIKGEELWRPFTKHMMHNSAEEKPFYIRKHREKWDTLLKPPAITIIFCNSTTKHNKITFS